MIFLVFLIYGLLLIVFAVPFAYKSVIVLYIVVIVGYKIRDRLPDPTYSHIVRFLVTIQMMVIN